MHIGHIMLGSFGDSGAFVAFSIWKKKIYSSKSWNINSNKHLQIAIEVSYLYV
jgi:hypothetical protein